MAHRGERVISRKAIAQGMSDVLRCPVCSCAHSLCTLRMRPRVQRASGIPCALLFREARNDRTSRALTAPRVVDARRFALTLNREVRRYGGIPGSPELKAS